MAAVKIHIIYNELLTIFRFAVIGITATLIHSIAAWFFISQFNIAPLVSSSAAFIFALFFSFTGHYKWTFQGIPHSPLRFQRFFLIALVGFLLNSAILTYLLSRAWLSPMQSTLISTLAIPVFTFLANRFWGFSNEK